MTETTAVPVEPKHGMFIVLAALAELETATAAAVAEKAGLAYSTTTAKLRGWRGSGHAEPFRTGTGVIMWRLTDTGRTATSSAEPATASAGPATPDPSERPAGNEPGSAEGPLAATTDHSQADASTEQQPGGAIPPDDQPPASRQVPDGEREPVPTQPVPTQSAPAEPDVEPAAEDNTVSAPAAEPVQARLAAEGAGAGTGPDPDGEAGDDDAAHETPSELSDESAHTDVETDGERRQPGTLRESILKILKANPDEQFRVRQLCALIDEAAEAALKTNAAAAKTNEPAAAKPKKASAGAVSNAAHKLVHAGEAVLAVERPTAFALHLPQP